MKTNYTLWQRIATATPPFFKRLQVLGIGIAGLGTALTQVIGISVKLTTVLISIGSTIAIVSQFAVKQLDNINTKKDDDFK